ncbi:hypothetical protein A1O1_05075 [Capronia coronata CBS 617.96]|uniref:Uncharacterized protein n=1 Tax=Capronia coronata CBS 617.96 TaxID=1182541 RepID=W9Y5N8_9EURO|nr:uncharacterized protein A1O1_05075 [Capronia coronata CBS 617.96]EXJ88147.1 hypothetical protein A1O1_05075 [Capronia coronata CBS 617.96]
MSTANTALFSPDDEQDLLRSGLLTPSIGGVRRIHKRRLNRSTTLQYLGFDDEAAKKIWDEWTNWPAGPILREIDDDGDCGRLAMTFIDFATGRAREDIDTYDEEDQSWFEYMSRCGIAQSLQQAIMDPVFKKIRLSNTCMYWVRDTMELRYEGLEEIRTASWERQLAIQRSRPESGSRGPGTQEKSRSGTDTSQGASSISASQTSKPGISPMTAMSDGAIASTNAPGFAVLFEGISQCRVEGLLDDDGNLAKLHRLITRPSTDFLGRESGYCFTTEREFAVYYACYAKRRDPTGLAVIICVKVPNSAIESLSSAQLPKTYWPSEEWRRLVFTSKN